MTTLRIALISDDLRGALDAAAPFVSACWPTVVATNPDKIAQARSAGADVLAVSLDSRALSAARAGVRARGAALALADVPCLFKKIDSRMKGHVGPGSAALATVRALARAVLCPAIPELGRQVVGGQVVGHDISNPVAVRADLGREMVVETPGALTDADLDAIVARSGDALLVGARGLVAALARRTGRGPVPPQAAVLPRPFVVVVGSQDPVTLMQVAQLRAEVPAARWIPAPDGVVPALSAPGAGLTILQAVAGPGADGPTVAARLARGLAGLVCGGQHTLVLTGGDTAAACLAAMDIGVLQLLGEALPCLPVSLPLDFPAGLIIVTRSGGFGDPDCLVQLWRDSRTAETADR